MRVRTTLSLAVVAVSAGLMGQTAQAAVYTWARGIPNTYSWDNSTVNGAVTNGNNWNSSLTVKYPDAAGDIANLTPGSGGGTETILLNQEITVGALTVGSGNNSTGPVNLNSGGTSTFALTLDNLAVDATLTHNNTTAPATINAPLVIAGNGNLNVANSHTTSTTNLVIAGGISTTLAAATLTNTAGTANVTGPVAGPVAVRVTGGNLNLSSAVNAYTGGTTVSAGTLQLSGAGVLPGNAVAVDGTLLLNKSADSTLSHDVSGSGSVAKSGTGTLTLAGNSSFTGTLFVDTDTQNNDGNVRLTSAAAAGNASLISIRNNNLGRSALQLDPGAGGSMTLNQPISLNARTNAASTSIQNLSGDNTLGGAITLNVGGNGYAFQSDAGSLTIQSDLTAGGGGLKILTLQGDADGTLTGVVANGASNTFAVTKAGAGTWTLAGANAYTGATTVSAGTLALGAADRIADASLLSLGGGTFATNGFSDVLGGLALSADSAIDFGDGSSTLTLADSSVQAWTGMLTINNWSGSPVGSGVDQLIFGNGPSALTETQLAQIHFAGFDPGAKILASGEVVPVPEPAGLALLTVAGCAVASRRRRR